MLSMILFASIAAQTCSQTGNLPTFNQCVRNGMTTPEGGVGPMDPYSACICKLILLVEKFVKDLLTIR
jgi:hypothetical protein